jgi:hypothetical protein
LLLLFLILTEASKRALLVSAFSTAKVAFSNSFVASLNSIFVSSSTSFTKTVTRFRSISAKPPHKIIGVHLSFNLIRNNPVSKAVISAA